MTTRGISEVRGNGLILLLRLFILLLMLRQATLRQRSPLSSRPVA